MKQAIAEYSVWSVVGAWIVTCFHYLYGDREIVYAMMTLIIILIASDWIAGSRASEKDYSYASQYGIDGIKRTAVVLMIPAMGNLLDTIFGFPSLIFGIFAGGLIYHYLKSLTANVARAGWDRWIPNFALEWVASEIEHKVARSFERRKEKEEALKELNKEQDHLPKM